MTTPPRHPADNMAMPDSASSQLVLMTCMEMFCPLEKSTREMTDIGGEAAARNCRTVVAAVQAKAAKNTEPSEVLTKAKSLKADHNPARSTWAIEEAIGPACPEEKGESELEAMQREVGVLSAKLKEAQRLLGERPACCTTCTSREAVIDMDSVGAEHRKEQLATPSTGECTNEEISCFATPTAQASAHADQGEPAAGDFAGESGWKALFKEFADGSASVDMDELENGLHKSALILSESETFQKKRVEGGALNVE
eukprot:2445091-Rhodomonas_salina.1